MDIFESLENLNVSEECFDEIMGLVEEIISEGRKEGESDTDFKIRTVDELSNSLKNKMSNMSTELKNKENRLSSVKNAAKNLHRKWTDKFLEMTKVPTEKSMQKLNDKQHRAGNAEKTLQNEVDTLKNNIFKTNKKIDKLSAIKSNAEIQKQKNK